ncbi:MAG: hypothetical protein COB36_12885 [Alphaproteobacteria bacterium]|nr:MAG: hypothetical protein COB36_12885 [Alphaproteobacteria bacterium]
MNRKAFIPPRHNAVFHNNIIHPMLWLWDSWTTTCGSVTDLYCLALARKTLDGIPITPSQRNLFKFHVRHFRSKDAGATWVDKGCIFEPNLSGDGAFERNVWSGSSLDLPDGRRLHALTGLRERGPDHTFLQTIFLAVAHSSDSRPSPEPKALLCPDRDYQRIRAAGYYLPFRSDLGANEGELGGPILAWRDPFLMTPRSGDVEIIWSAKVSPKTPAIGHAKIIEDSNGTWRVSELYNPILLPDANLMTQAEVPKIYWDTHHRKYYLLISACDRQSESQPEVEVTKVLRFYTSDAPYGPWRPWSKDGSALTSIKYVFGASVINLDVEANTIKLITPLTEYAPPDLQLTIAPVITVEIGDIPRP